MNPEPMENKAVRLAAKQLLTESDYASDSQLGRMAEYTRSLFRGRNTFGEVDIAAQIAAAQGNYPEAVVLTGKAIDMYEGGDEKAAELYLRMGLSQQHFSQVMQQHL